MVAVQCSMVLCCFLSPPHYFLSSPVHLPPFSSHTCSVYTPSIHTLHTHSPHTPFLTSLPYTFILTLSFMPPLHTPSSHPSLTFSPSPHTPLSLTGWKICAQSMTIFRRAVVSLRQNWRLSWSRLREQTKIFSLGCRDWRTRMSH